MLRLLTLDKLANGTKSALCVCRGAGMAYYDSVWNKALRQYVDSNMANTKYAKLCTTCLSRLKRKYYKTSYVEAIMQRQERGREDYDIYHAAAFMDIHVALCRGQVLMTTLEVGQAPSGNLSVDKNQHVLDMLMQARITSTGDKPEVIRFMGQYAASSQSGNDGFLWWNGTVRFGNHTSGKYAEVSNGKLPLEVGFTAPSITISHLSQDGGLARWPYGSTRIWLFYVVDPYAWSAPLPHNREAYQFEQIIREQANQTAVQSVQLKLL